MTTVRRAYTLVEVVIAILLSTVMISAVLSVGLSNKSSGGKLDRRLVASQAEHSTLQLLKNYVTADPFSGYSLSSSIAGPNGGGSAGPCGWTLDKGDLVDDYGGACPVSGCCWALAPGVHGITGAAGKPGLVPPLIFAPPYNGTLSYDVTWLKAGVVNPGGCYNPPNPIPSDCTPEVKVSVDWSEP
ncbi:MAG: type II secretion system protein [Elusimicrobia bacterium]|nr:type II secretion system protein [Elusimicrobiota bacterium]